ncbi:T7SS effector LXG polymorphic toxin [Bacillus cereus group sp. TH208-1LC]|uniref:T7SS effector LXG polymorphic toxin n=1 Tax=Bacillus cereus group sp. TH208-1LC TaxID=3018052 RepID=UPI000C287C49|nr:T7SS effector LXG polymorphic toxin [Bacillus cereus group sp. TH208-1LC]MDA1605832.1 T7SS effector LXG polymorphic toxin [Bacillus cereus group sp. TH208-1LC]
MSLNMYLGEVQSQTQSMNAICNATIQSMEQAIQSIDAFAIDTVLQGQTYSSAKAYLVQTFRPLAQGIICLCEELIRQNEAFPNDFQAKVASTDVIEHEIRQQIQEINQSIASIEAIEVLTPMPGVDAIIAVLIAMRKKLEEKLERLYEFNHSSSNNYSTALQLAASITAGLAEVQSGKGFSPVSGTFSTQRLNMDWVSSIQGIIEETARKNEMKEITLQKQEMNLQEQEDNRSWHEKTALYAQTFLHGVIEFFQGAGDAALENFVGLQPHENDKLESKTTYQAGRLAGNVISIAGSIVEIFEGISLIGGSNFLTIVAEVGTGGLASPIVIPLDIAATAAGASLFAHGGFVWDKSIQNAKDTLQRIQSSGGGKGTGKTTEPYDVVPYRPSNSPLENHHGVMDVWAKHNVPDYVSRGANTPTIALTKEQHNDTKAVYRQWLFEKTGKKVGGKVDWKSVSPKEIQELTEKMFDAANVPRLARQEYYRAFNQYNFRE